MTSLYSIKPSRVLLDVFKYASVLLLVLLITPLSGCSVTGEKPERALEPVVEQSETKEVVAESGFGGTGRVPEEPSTVAAIANPASLRHTLILDGGFGGTGQTASGFGGTGFVGTIDRFGSVWVNGIEIGLGQKTKITSNLTALNAKSTGQPQSLTAADLRIGQQVWLETEEDQDKTITSAIHVYYPLVGKIEEIKSQGMATEILVNGQRVYIGTQTVLPEHINLSVGEFVQISGVPVYAENSLQRSNTWQATLIEPNEAKLTWFGDVPDIKFSERVNRVMMHPSWSKAYQAGEFKGLPEGLSAKPKIKVIGEEANYRQGTVIDPLSKKNRHR